MAEDSDIQQSSSMDASFNETKVFFGPITDYEKEVRERYRKAMEEKGISLAHFDDSIRDVSEDSHYESFSTESKYDSFNDSLNIAQDLNSSDKKAAPTEINVSNFLSEQVNANGKKTLIDKKNLTGQFCDSLEDIHSLVSSGDKFSLSEEIEDINIVEVSHTCDDSLKNDICIANKNSNELCFDEDSLAILEYEKAFDDSLEDSNGPSVSHLDSLMLSKSKANDVDSLNEKVLNENKVSKSYFETSVQVIYENSKEAGGDVGNLEDCNKKSSCVSEGNLYRDSLEDLSDLPIQQNTSSASSYKSISTDHSIITSSNDMNDNKQESKSAKRNIDVEDFNLIFNKSTSKKSSTTFLKPLIELTTMQNSNLNETICIDDSILPLDSDVDSRLADINTECKNCNNESQNEKVTKLSLSPLDSNNTICIDDSVISSSFATACSFLTNNFAPQSTANSNDFVSMEVDKANVEENAKNSNGNDTIWIEDSIIEPLDKHSSLVLDYSKDDNVSTSDAVVIDPVIPSKSLGIVDVNETICIDDSIVLPFEPDTKNEISLMEDNHVKKNRRHGKNFEKDFQKLRISDVDKHPQAGISRHGSPSNAGSTMIDIVVRSPIHKCQNNSNISDNCNMRKKENSDKSSMLSPETHNERNLKVHIEVKNQGVNVISVSEEHCASPQKLDKYVRVSETVKEFKEKDSNLDKVKLKSIDSYSQKSSSSGLCALSKKLESHSNRNKVEQKTFLEDLDVKYGKHDVSLFQALDLHDSSINVSKNESLLSRDSFMPLNLCVRERSFEKPNKIPRNESKENIPFISYKVFAAKKQNTPKQQKTKAASPKKNKGTPLKNACVKQQLNNCDIKKAATKIPIRKLNNAPVIQRKQKLDSKPSCNSDKPDKSPFVVPSCPGATLHKEGSEETPKKLHHFCMVRNSISRVPKSSQKNAPKKFQNIQSPVAKYIGNPSVQIPLKTTHRYDGNLFPTNAEPSVVTMKTPRKIGPSGTPTSVKSDKKF